MILCFLFKIYHNLDHFSEQHHLLGECTNLLCSWHCIRLKLFWCIHQHTSILLFFHLCRLLPCSDEYQTFFSDKAKVFRCIFEWWKFSDFHFHFFLLLLTLLLFHQVLSKLLCLCLDLWVLQVSLSKCFSNPFQFFFFH